MSGHTQTQSLAVHCPYHMPTNQKQNHYEVLIPAHIPMSAVSSKSYHPGKDSKATYPVPWRIVIQLFIVTAIDAVAVGLPAPFLPAMCRGFFGDDAESVSIAVGVLVGSFLLSNFFSSFVIGHLSDRLGRKPLLLIGLFVVRAGLLSGYLAFLSILEFCNICSFRIGT